MIVEMKILRGRHIIAKGLLDVSLDHIPEELGTQEKREERAARCMFEIEKAINASTRFRCHLSQVEPEQV